MSSITVYRMVETSYQVPICNSTAEENKSFK